MFRTGKSHTSRGVKRFISECLKMIPDDIREIYLRADSGFYDSDFMDYLEQKGIRYTIVVKLNPWIQMELVGINYRDIGGGISVG
ncbi:transposase, partial [Desulfobacterota bacterium AH_259_B03_O07]|nr:transposase [Desulfobacterota bacterium AH_259_B03_O07]